MKKEIPCIFYLYLHSKFKEKAGDLIEVKEAKSFMFQWKIPTIIRPLILKEMEKLGLVRRHKRFWLKLNKSNFNIENLNLYFRELGFY